MTDLIAQHLDQFAQTRIGKRRQYPRANTLRVHRLCLERFAEAMSGQSLTVNACKDYLNRIAKANGASSVNQNLAAITAYLRWLADEGQFPRDDLESWQSFHKSQYQPWQPPEWNYKYLDHEQLARVFGCLRGRGNETRGLRDVAFFGCLLLLPARIHEAALLRTEHLRPVEADEHYPARFEVLIPAPIAKNGKDHLGAVFSDRALIGECDVYDALAQYWQWRQDLGPQPSDALFVSLRAERFGQPASPRSWAKVFATAARKADLKISSHWLRHSYGEFGRGVLDDRDMRQLFSHSSAKTTEIYVDHDNHSRLLAAQYRAAGAISEH